MEENKDEILANFQSITCIDDLGEAFSHLEETNWDLMTAIQRVIPQEDSIPGSINVPPLSSIINNPSTNHVTALNNFSNLPTLTPRSSRWDSHGVGMQSAFLPIASTSSSSSIIDLTTDMDTETTHQNDDRSLIFNIHFNQQIYTIRLPYNATVEQLKNKITNVTGVPACRQALRGWPPAKLHAAQIATTELSSLGLSNENELILIDLTTEGFEDFENDEVANRLNKMFTLTIVEQPSGKQLKLNMSGRATIQEVKENMYSISEIPVRHQEWTGWPIGCDNRSTLAQSGIELSHNFILQNADEKNKNNNKASTSYKATNTVALDTDSSADEFEDASDFNASEDFFTDSLPTIQPQSRHLIANNTHSEATGSTEFVENYVARYGEPHPTFFTGSLEDAIKEACHKPAKDRKLLAIYLHHGESILTNVFCDRLLKHESIIEAFEQNFVVYGWDLTFESNKHLFLSSITACVNNTATLTVRNIPLDKLPAILVIGKSRMSGRSICEVLSVIHGNVGLDDLLSRLIESVEVYRQHLQVEIREEDERAARDQVKAEQDMAYQEALQADMAKDAAKRQKEAAIAAERQRLESEKAEEDARRESIRLVAEQSLPDEPSEYENNLAKIRVRKPTGDFLERRFYAANTLQDLLNFVASHGFLIEDYKLISSWPRRDLTSIDANETLESLKLYPQETVILEER